MLITKYQKQTALFFILAAVLLISPPATADNGLAMPESAQEQTSLQRQLDEIESQIQEFQQQLNTIKGQKNTLQNKIKELQTQQKTLNLQIQSTNLQVADLEARLTETRADISLKTQESQILQQQLAQTLVQINERDDYPFLYTVIGQNTLSKAFDEVENYTQISKSLKDLLQKTQNVKNELSQQEQSLVQQQDDAENLLSIKTLQQQQVVDSVGQQNSLLQQTKGKESDYQIVLSDTQKQAQGIRSRLYQLLGVSNQITFGDAVEIAQWASAQTGVRAAFLLAILTQESNLGKNVGTCNRAGDPPEKSYKVVMNPTRDQPPFLEVTQSLGRDPEITPVSCPIHDSKGKQVGWGGAMGPAQFIPSTWVGYKDKVAALTGKSADPWDIRDAFLAAGIKLAAGGATSQSGEWAAAMRYFSGSTNTKYRFYGDNVVATANQYQNDIDQLNK